MEFCCPQMKSAVNDPDVPMCFNPKFREFGIGILDGGSSTLQVLFCPWCGEKLLNSLRDDWFDKIEQSGIDPYGDKIPEEFTDERWYSQPSCPNGETGPA